MNEITLAEKKAHLETLTQRIERHGWGASGREDLVAGAAALRREIEREEAEIKAKLPTLTEIERHALSMRQFHNDLNCPCCIAAAEIVKLVREFHKNGGEWEWLINRVGKIASLS